MPKTGTAEGELHKGLAAGSRLTVGVEVSLNSHTNTFFDPNINNAVWIQTWRLSPRTFLFNCVWKKCLNLPKAVILFLLFSSVGHDRAAYHWHSWSLRWLHGTYKWRHWVKRKTPVLPEAPWFLQERICFLSRLTLAGDTDWSRMEQNPDSSWDLRTQLSQEVGREERKSI